MSFWPSSLGKSKQYFHSEKEVREAGSEPQLSLNVSHDCELFQHMDGPEGKAVYLIPCPDSLPKLIMFVTLRNWSLKYLIFKTFVLNNVSLRRTFTWFTYQTQMASDSSRKSTQIMKGLLTS